MQLIDQVPIWLVIVYRSGSRPWPSSWGFAPASGAVTQPPKERMTSHWGAGGGLLGLLAFMLAFTTGFNPQPIHQSQNRW